MLLPRYVQACRERGLVAAVRINQLGGTVRRDFTQGIGRLAGRFVVILEPGKAFDIDKMARLCEATQAAAG